MSAGTEQTATRVVDLTKRFIAYTLAEMRLTLCTLILVLLAPVLAAGLLWAFKVLVDEVLVGGRIELLATFAIFYVGIIVLKLATAYLTEWLEASVTQRINQALRRDLYNHVLGLSPGSLDKQTPGDVLTRMRGDVERTEYLVYTLPLSVIADALTALVFLALLLQLSWKLTLCALLTIPFLVWVSYRLSPVIRRAAGLSRTAEAGWMSLAEDRLGALALVQAFGMRAAETSAFDARCARTRWTEVKTAQLQAWQTCLIEAAAAAGGLLVLTVGAYQIKSGGLTVGELVAFIGSIGSLTAPIRNMAKAAGRFQHAAAGAERVAALLATPSLVKDMPGAAVVPRARGAIEFRDIHFTYPGGAKVLDGLSLRIEPGETIALVGPSGGGKSTLLRLLLRLYDPDQGAVLVDGLDVRNMTLQSLRANMSTVFQEAQMIDASIAGNIRYGAPMATGVEIERAARAAAVDRFARLAAGGLSAAVGSRGSHLSGGQRQRVALSRALLHDAPILLLDEATAALDGETETVIQAALDRCGGKHTVLVVAHRLSSIVKADRVVVIEHGRIVEAGQPQRLLASPGRCRDLFLSQLNGAEIAA